MQDFAIHDFLDLTDRAPAPSVSVFVPVQPRLEGAVYPVSDVPGLGVEVNEELIRQQSFSFWEAPHLRRRDGSATNW